MRARVIHFFQSAGSWLLAFLVIICVSAPCHVAAEKKALLIGIEPEHNIFDQVQKYRVLAKYLSGQLGFDVKLTIVSRYGELIKRFRSLHLDGAILNSYTATLAVNELDLTPVANIVNTQGDSTSRGYIFVRKDSGIKGVEDMRGKSMVFVDPATTEGYVYARAYFRQHGVQDLNSYFSRYYFSGSHASAVFAVLDGRADIGSAKGDVFDTLVKKDRSILNEIDIVAKSQVVPGVTLCIKNDLDPEVHQALRTTLLNMNQSAEGYKVLKQMDAKRFVQARPEDFEVVVQLAERAGLQMRHEQQ